MSLLPVGPHLSSWQLRDRKRFHELGQPTSSTVQEHTAQKRRCARVGNKAWRVSRSPVRPTKDTECSQGPLGQTWLLRCRAAGLHFAVKEEECQSITMHMDSVPTVTTERPSAAALEDKPNWSHFLGGAPRRLWIRKPARFPGTSAGVGPAERSYNP